MQRTAWKISQRGRGKAKKWTVDGLVYVYLFSVVWMADPSPICTVPQFWMKMIFSPEIITSEILFQRFHMIKIWPYVPDDTKERWQRIGKIDRNDMYNVSCKSIIVYAGC